jgi:hypothetical protein
MKQDTQLSFDLPSVGAKKVSAAFDGGRLTSDGGVALLARADTRMNLVARLAALVPDRRDPARVTHDVASIIRARVFAIACGYEDGDDLDHLRADPAFKLACGRLPDTGMNLCSQPTVSRFENAPDLKTIVRLTRALVDIYCTSFAAPPAAVTLDIDDTVDAVHGAQQLSLFNAYEDAYCFKPIHVYDAATGRPVVIILRPGKTPSGKEVRGWLRRIVGQIRTHWPTTKLTIRGDGHYGREEAMAWCEANRVDFIFGRPINTVLRAIFEPDADPIRVVRAEQNVDAVRGFAEASYAAKSWSRARRVIARMEASRQGFDIRTIVTSLETGTPEHLYTDLYCARGNAENLIKLHKTQLKSDRTSCSSPRANQFRLILHTAAYWLMLSVRDAIPMAHTLAKAEFNTIRSRLLKIGARIVETAARVRIAFAAACPERGLFVALASALMRAAPA